MKAVKKNALFNFNRALDFPIVLENKWVRKGKGDLLTAYVKF